MGWLVGEQNKLYVVLDIKECFTKPAVQKQCIWRSVSQSVSKSYTEVSTADCENFIHGTASAHWKIGFCDTEKIFIRKAIGIFWELGSCLDIESWNIAPNPCSQNSDKEKSVWKEFFTLSKTARLRMKYHHNWLLSSAVRRYQRAGSGWKNESA